MNLFLNILGWLAMWVFASLFFTAIFMSLTSRRSR